MRTIETPTTKILTLLIALAGVATAGVLSGAADGSCIPIEEPVCFADIDCGAGMMCDLDANACVDAALTITTSAASYAPGESVTFHIDPHGLPVETGGWDALYAYVIDWLDPVTMEWLELRAGMPFGCYMTDCIEDQPMILCVDPAPPACVERVAPYDLVWDGYLWSANDTDCGGQLQTSFENLVATPGDYRVRYRFGLDAEPDDLPADWGACTHQDQWVEAYFTIQ